MPIFSPPKWLRRSHKWQQLFVLFLVGLLAWPLAGAQAMVPNLSNTATATYTVPNGPDASTTSNQVETGFGLALLDPFGNILGCDGQPLADYSGFSAALYEPDASGLDINTTLGAIALRQPAPGEPSFAPPNTNNDNPFWLSATQGRYSFLFDTTDTLSSGLTQTEVGATYILVINPPADSAFGERRIRIKITANIPDATNPVAISYRATSLDGQPIAIDGSTTLDKTVEVSNGNTVGLTFFEVGFDTVICETQQVDIIKSADRSAAQPGDIVAYRINIRNVTAAGVDSIVAIDTLPIGFEFVPEATSAQADGRPIDIKADFSGQTISFRTNETLAGGQSLDILYAVRLTPDALRGDGTNRAEVTAERTDSGFRVQDGPSVHRINLEPGILSDCGTLIGRVFEDKDFDGEQQPGEAGIPNAVIFLDDGNRVMTDADGLFSVQKMLPGQRTGTLDLASLPGYTLAPNLYFNERNSHARLVNLAPGGLVRMNFGVTPTFQEEQE